MSPDHGRRVFTLFAQDGELRGLDASDQPLSLLAISQGVRIGPGDGQEIKGVAERDDVSAPIGDRFFFEPRQLLGDLR